MSRSASYYYDPEMQQANKPSACGTCLRYTWKTITFLFSHITLVSMVVSYCILGAVTFQHLEEENEKEVKRNISKIRKNITDEIWKLTIGSKYLREDLFIESVIERLKDFDTELLKAITKDGWDGDENTDHVQWSLAGALFYSIIVITTIGYGHIAPKTPMGKVVTIFYAVLGIPLMLLCLSNIGDIMATSFRFLYWRVCCYFCTKKPKRNRRGRSTRGTIRGQSGSRVKSRNASIKRSGRTSTRSADSAFASSYSESELRYHEDLRMSQYKRGQSLPRMRLTNQDDEFSDLQCPGPAGIPQNRHPRISPQRRGGSLDRRRPRQNLVDPTVMSSIKIVTNRYVVDEGELQGQVPGLTIDERKPKIESTRGRSQTLPGRDRGQVTLERGDRRSLRNVRRTMPYPDDYDSEDEVRIDIRSNSIPPRNTLDVPREGSPTGSSLREDRQRKRKQNIASPRIMSPLGYRHKPNYLDNESDSDYGMDESGPDPRNHNKPVPIWLCVFLVVSYIIAGTFLFSNWEGWPPLDAAYFCFITLTTIGFGDLVPAKRVEGEEFKKNIAFCSLYLLFGIALLAMSFNLVQEEVIANVKRVAKTLGIIKSEEEEEEED